VTAVMIAAAQSATVNWSAADANRAGSICRERAPDAFVADKAYDSDAIRDDLKQRGIRAVTPPKSNRCVYRKPHPY
jgi:hypothetical protein